MNHWSKQPTPNVMEHPQEGKMAALPFILRFYGNELKKTLETESTNCVVFFFSHFGFLRQVFSVVLFFVFYIALAILELTLFPTWLEACGTTLWLKQVHPVANNVPLGPIQKLSVIFWDRRWLSDEEHILSLQRT